MRQRGFGYPERRIDVGFEGCIEIGGGKLLNFFTVLLTTCIVHNNIQTAKTAYRFFHQRFTEGFHANIARYRHRRTAFRFDKRDDGVRIALFFRKIVNGNIRAFAGKGDSHGATNTGVSAGNQRFLTL